LNCPRSIAAAVALTTQNTNIVMSGLALRTAIVVVIRPFRPTDSKKVLARYVTVVTAGSPRYQRWEKISSATNARFRG